MTARATEHDLFSALDRLGIAHRTVEHSPLFTVEDGRDWHDKIPGLHCKNLFLKDRKDKLWLVVMPGDMRADIGYIEKQLGAARLSFAKPELLLDVLGLRPGAVTPFGLINDTHKRVTVGLDATLLDTAEVNFHPLRNTASTTIKSTDLVNFIKALGYEPRLIRCNT